MSLYGRMSMRGMTMSRESNDDNLGRNLLILLGVLLVVNLVISSITLYKKQHKSKEGFEHLNNQINNRISRY